MNYTNDEYEISYEYDTDTNFVKYFNLSNKKILNKLFFNYFNSSNKKILNKLIDKLVSLNLYKYYIIDNGSYFLINFYLPNITEGDASSQGEIGLITNNNKHIYIKKSKDLFMYYFDNPVIYLFNNDLNSFVHNIN